MVDLSRQDKVTIFISTHFMNEAERCDRISLMHAGKVLASGTPLFWQLMVDLSRQDKVTIFISTHFMNEAERCDRISLMHAGKVLASGTPQELVEKRGAASLEEAFFACLQEAAGQSNEAEAPPVVHDTTHAPRQGFSLRRLFS